MNFTIANDFPPHSVSVGEFLFFFFFCFFFNRNPCFLLGVWVMHRELCAWSALFIGPGLRRLGRIRLWRFPWHEPPARSCGYRQFKNKHEQSKLAIYFCFSQGSKGFLFRRIHGYRRRGSALLCWRCIIIHGSCNPKPDRRFTSSLSFFHYSGAGQCIHRYDSRHATFSRSRSAGIPTSAEKKSTCCYIN